MNNSAGRGGFNILRDLQNSPYPTKAEFNNCFIIHSKYFQENLTEQREFFEYICPSFFSRLGVKLS